jgi:hypothetical protein
MLFLDAADKELVILAKLNLLLKEVIIGFRTYSIKQFANSVTIR